MGDMRSRACAARTLRAGACLALLALFAAGLTPLGAAQGPLSVLGVECGAGIRELGIDKQLNMRAGLIRIGCGVDQAGQPGTTRSRGGPGLEPAPPNINTITELETFPKVTQSESMVWSSDGTTIVVNYNDSRTSPSNYSGVSVSTDGGATFTRLTPAPFATGHGTNFGDPIVVFNAALSTWFAGDLATGCGGQGIGLWTSPDGVTWSTGACAHSGVADDRESMWVDNSPDSPFYGRMYISWNNFSVGARLFVTHSDDGTLWSTPVPLSAGFIRDVQLTGSPGPDGTMFVAGMNEGGGGFNNRTNLMYRSSDGGDTWTEITMGDPFAPPGDSLCSNPFFARIFPIWRHQGWGHPGVGSDGVVHYAYAGKGVNPGDAGDIYYTQSLDNGDTWSTPIVLNTDQAADGTRSQWMPSLSVTASGKLTVSWYDRRNTTDGQNYEVWGRQSPDNGVTWLPDAPISEVLIPQPEQPDPAVQACYAGDYNYTTAFGDVHYVTWTDGRNAVSDHFQQDVYFASLTTLGGPPVCTMVENPTPDYTDATNKCALGTPGSFTSDCTVDGQPVVTFSRELSVFRVPANTWATWSSPPFSESTTPIVGFTQGASVLSVDLGANASSIAGFELEPNVFDEFPVTAVFLAADGSELGRVARTVAGQAGARLFAADCGTAFISAIRVTVPPEAQGFAIAQVRGNNLPPAAGPAEPPATDVVRAVPEGATANAQ